MNYPVTTPFGQVPGYPLNNGWHNGIDYGFPMGSSVIVNGVEIGISNNTGATTGPHLHIGKWVGGKAVDPGVGNGFQFNSAVVFDTGFDPVNGNYVRVTGDGALWCYLHLQKALVTKGQVLKGGNMQPVPTRAEVQSQFMQFQGSPATKKQEDYYIQPDKGYATLNGDLLQEVFNELQTLKKSGSSDAQKKLDQVKAIVG